MLYRPIMQAAHDAGRTLNRLFVISDEAINCNQPQHIKNWKIFQVEEGIWAVFYDGAQKALQDPHVVLPEPVYMPMNQVVTSPKPNEPRAFGGADAAVVEVNS